MKPFGPGCRWQCRGATALAPAIVFALHLAISAHPAFAAWQSSQDRPQPLSLSDYIDRLKSLDSQVANCRQERSQKSGIESCDPAKIGPDLIVEWGAGAKTRREICFGWLRLLLQSAHEKDKPAAEINSAQSPAPGPGTHQAPPITVDALLAQASDRLSSDEKQAEDTDAVPQPSRTDRDRERKSLNEILSRKEYRSVTEVSWKERVLDALANWLNRLFARLAGNSSRWPWAVVVFNILWIGALCLGLGWFFIRLERRSRVRLGPAPASVPGAVSAREWQLWLADARSMAAEGRWREAIHFVYWASISRLESRRLWPADRARTPREYLRLLPRGDARTPSLATLTSSFERTWYGGQEAISSDYQAALQLAAELGVE